MEDKSEYTEEPGSNGMGPLRSDNGMAKGISKRQEVMKQKSRKLKGKKGEKKEK